MEMELKAACEFYLGEEVVAALIAAHIGPVRIHEMAIQAAFMKTVPESNAAWTLKTKMQKLQQDGQY